MLAVFVAEVVAQLQEHHAHRDLGGVGRGDYPFGDQRIVHAASTTAATALKLINASIAAKLATYAPSLACR